MDTNRSSSLAVDKAAVICQLIERGCRLFPRRFGIWGWMRKWPVSPERLDGPHSAKS
jgi:hypothetical protein